MAKLSCREVIDLFRMKSATTTCKEVVRVLGDLGFVVKPGSKGKHHTYTHPRLKGFRAGFDCGHGRNPDVLPFYVKDIAKNLEEFEGDL